MKPCKEKKIRKDKSDRATVDKVLDKNTIKILDKLIKRNKLTEVQGSICTGKEANVYMGMGSTDLYSKYIKSIHLLKKDRVKNKFNMNSLQELLNKKIEDIDLNNEMLKDFFDLHFKLSEKEKTKKVFVEEDNRNIENTTEQKESDMIPVAIKIYKTSICPFKDRERYIEGEKRFTSFCKKNSRKLIKLWAEKELRNLKRLNRVGILSPEPIYFKRNILIMSLIGDLDNVASRLKDANIEDMDLCYRKCVDIINDMYNKAGLVHADISEYNLLYYKNDVYVIDVGQSVETTHINSDYFLISDIINLNNFFKKNNCNVIDEKELYQKISGKTLPSYIKDISMSKHMFIPSKIEDVKNLEDLKLFISHSENVDNTTEEHQSEEPKEDSHTTNSDEESETVQKSLKDVLSKSERKKLVKGFNRERRASRITKTEKNRLFKRYKGKRSKK